MSSVSSSSVSSIDVSPQFEQRGYVCPLTVMSPDAARGYHAQFEQAERDFGSQSEFAKMLRRYPNLVLPFIDEITRLPAITDVVAEILGPDLLVLDAPFFIKDAQSKSFVSWHQDLHYWGLESDEEVTAWVALTPATHESGCMRFVPESHRQRVEHEDTYAQDNLLTRGQAVAVEVDESQAIDAELQSGQMSIHHGRVFHASHPNTSDSRRVGLALRYITPQARQQRVDHDFATLVRGEDRFGHFELEPEPHKEMDPDFIALHARISDVQAKIYLDGTNRAGIEGLRETSEISAR